MAPVPMISVVVDRLLAAVDRGESDAVGVGIDVVRLGVEPESDAGVLEVRDRAVREVVPVADFAGHVVRDAADRVVRVRIGEHHGDVGGRVELARAQRALDPRVATADRD
jgi:hypothetical protein